MSEFEWNNYENNDLENTDLENNDPDNMDPEPENREENTDQVIPAETEDHAVNQEQAGSPEQEGSPQQTASPEPSVRGRYTYQGTSSDYSGRPSYDSGNYRDEGPGGNGGRKKNSFGKTIAKIVAGAAVFGLVSGAVAFGVNTAADHLIGGRSTEIEATTKESETQAQAGGSAESGSTAGQEASANTAASSAVTATDVSAVVDKVMPSVVSINGMYRTTGYFGETTQSEGAGSGFIIAKTKDKLMVATNAHVVANSTSLTVAFSDGTTAPATIVGQDTEADLAVVSVNLSDIKKDTLNVIKVAVLNDKEELKVGQSVIAIGNALGYGQSVTTGVISALDREVSFTDGTMTLLQTDAAINPGNSGGVLIDTQGNVIGINNAKLSDTQVEGMGYAIPISSAKSILETLMNAEQVDEKDQAFLGVVGKTIDKTYSQQLGMPMGIYVTEVVSGSPAEKAGVSYGDIIVKFNGNDVSTMKGLKEKISILKAGKDVTVTVKRADQSGEYKEKDIKVTLGKKSDFATENNSENQDSQNGQDFQDGGNSQDPQYGNGQDGQQGQEGEGTNPYEYFFNDGEDGSANPYDFFFNY